MFFSIKKISFKLFLAITLLTSTQLVHAQCFEIESILVDACGPGSLEGENEMIRFKVGGTALNSSNLSANYPTSNSFLGICQNSASATATAALNATITACGFLIEPPGGILPANASVLFLTSTDVDITANSFANLNDTLYVVFQCAGNTGGHFGNSSSGIKNFSISFSSPSGCSDVVSWQNSNLVGGNGALVNFDPAGNASFSNNGCQAPINPLNITAINLTAATICPGDTIDITATTQGIFQSYVWTGGNGTFADPTTITTSYYSSTNDITPFYLKIKGFTACGDSISDSLLISIATLPNAIITVPDTNNICQGANITLNATGTAPFTWSDGTIGSSITVATDGMYFVSSSNNCFTASDTVYVFTVPQIIVSISEPDTNNVCFGSQITLHANGAASYTWSNGATTDSITVNSSGLFSVTANSACPSNTDSSFVNIIPQVNTDIIESDTVSVCTGSSITLHSTGNSDNLWSTGASNIDSITTSTAGYYFVTVNNSCFSDSAFIQVNIIPQLNVSILEADTNILCQGSSITLHAAGAPSYLWNTGVIANSIAINSSGTYTVTANSSCPSNFDTVFVDFVTPSTPIITEGNSATLCNGSSITLHVTGGNNYTWNDNSTFDSLTINATGVYYVANDDGICPTQYDSILIESDFTPLATIIGDTIFCQDEPLTVFANGVGNFAWSNGDTGTQTTITTGQQLILTASNNCNISAFDTLNVTTEDCKIETSLFAPNTITPNGDGKNDVFKVIGINVETFTCQIYNRWGQLLFEWKDINEGWDGTYNNKDVPTGTYIYTVQARFINGVNERLTGHVTLLK